MEVQCVLPATDDFGADEDWRQLLKEHLIVSITEYHKLISVLTRPTQSAFTRVQVRNIIDFFHWYLSLSDAEIIL